MPEPGGISGLADGRFSAVADAFADALTAGDELGAGLAVCVDGELVIDLRGGWRDRARTEPWNEDTIVCIYSTGKAVLSLLVAREVARGRLDYDRAVAVDWPEFAAAGKGNITLGDVMSHQAGLVGFADEIDPALWLDFDAVTARIADMAPLYPPGSASGYSPQLSGFVIGEMLRRATGLSVGALLRTEFPALDIFCGLRPEEIARAAAVQKPPRAPDLGEPSELKAIAFLKPWSSPARVALPAWMAAEIPASNMHADARSLARFAAAFANDGAGPGGAGVFVDADKRAALARALTVRIEGPDRVLPFNLAWTAGLMSNIAGHFGPSRTAFGQAGFGGSCVVADPACRLSVAYVMNRMSPHLVGDPRALRLIKAVYACL